MEPVVLDRTDDIPISFRGRAVAEVTSAAPGKDRHTELRLWLVDDGSYVVESVGVSTVPGEVTLRSANHCGTVTGVIASLRKSDASRGSRRSYLPDLAWSLLRAAHDAGAIEVPKVEAVGG